MIRIRGRRNVEGLVGGSGSGRSAVRRSSEKSSDSLPTVVRAASTRGSVSRSRRFLRALFVPGTRGVGDSPGRRADAGSIAIPAAKVAERVGDGRVILGRVPTNARYEMPPVTPSIWIIVPTYNERDNVGPITDAILQTVPQAHVLIVDDGSPDGTGELADELARGNPAIAVLHRTQKQGLGRAYVAAFEELLARGADVVVQIDADFSHPVRFLPGLLEPLVSDRADVVLGSRYVKGGHIPRWNLVRRVVSRGGSLFAGVVLLMPYRDLTGGFKAWKASVLRDIRLDRLHAGGYAFQIETTFRARLAGARVVEVPITFEERRVGQSKMTMDIFMEAFRLVLALRFTTLRRRQRGIFPLQ